jgi:heme exporter protein CcmD
MNDIPHLGFIVAAFVVAAVTIVGMIAAILWDYRDLSARLARLEDRR